MSNLQAELALERIIIERNMNVAETHRQNPTSDWQKDDCTRPTGEYVCRNAGTSLLKERSPAGGIGKDLTEKAAPSIAG